MFWRVFCGSVTFDVQKGLDQVRDAARVPSRTQHGRSNNPFHPPELWYLTYFGDKPWREARQSIHGDRWDQSINVDVAAGAMSNWPLVVLAG